MPITPVVGYPSNAVQNTPYGLDQQLPVGSPAVADSASTVVQTDLLSRDLSTVIKTLPLQFVNCIAVLANKPKKPQKSDVVEWWEEGYTRTPLVVGGAASAGAALSAGAFVTDTVVFTTASVRQTTKDTILAFPVAGGVGTTEKVTVMTVDYATGSVLVSSFRGRPIPALPAGTNVPTMGKIKADGTTDIPGVDRITFGQRDNYLGRFYRAKRWDRVEMKVWKNTQNIDVISRDMRNLDEEIMRDAITQFWNGTQGQGQDASGKVSKTMGGIFPYMVAGGAIHQTGVTPATLQSSFETLAGATNFLADGGTRFLFARHAILTQFSNIYKETLVRYEWDGDKVDRDLHSIKVGGCTYVLVPTECFNKAAGLFDDSWHNRIMCVNMDAIDVCTLDGLDFFKSGIKSDGLMEGDGSHKDYTIFYAEMNFTTRIPEPRQHFAMDMIGVA